MTKPTTIAIRVTRIRIKSRKPLPPRHAESIGDTGTKAAAAPEISSGQQAEIRRDALVLEHLALAKIIALSVLKKIPVHMELDDLVQAGVIGLFDAATKFDAGKHVNFSQYAKHRIKGAVFDSLRKLDWASRDMRRRQKRAQAIKQELTAILQRPPTEAEFAEKLGMDIARCRVMMLNIDAGPVSADTRANQDDDLPALEFPGDPESRPDFVCVRSELRSILGQAIKTLPDRYQKVVMLYYTNELNMKEIGGILGINESRVSQIHKLALEKMGIVLNQNGVDSIRAFKD